MSKYKVRDTQFGKDFDKPMNINGRDANKGWYNLVLSIAELKMYIRGLKPHRNYTLKGVKAYFGLDMFKYNKHELLNCLESFKRQLEDYNGMDTQSE